MAAEFGELFFGDHGKMSTQTRGMIENAQRVKSNLTLMVTNHTPDLDVQSPTLRILKADIQSLDRLTHPAHQPIWYTSQVDSAAYVFTQLVSLHTKDMADIFVGYQGVFSQKLEQVPECAFAGSIHINAFAIRYEKLILFAQQLASEGKLIPDKYADLLHQADLTLLRTTGGRIFIP